MKITTCYVVAWLSWFSAAAIAASPESTNIRCSESGRKFSAEFKKENTSEISIYGNPEFHYNGTLATCLVYTEVVDGAPDINSVWYSRRITDIYSNKVLAYSRYFITKSDPAKKVTLVNLGNVGDVVNMLPAEFAATRAELFRQ
ncbi:MAG: hypothetical protein Q7S85_08300 [Rugosibacter sp.]|nr:hypothetical protein [Rugosibacter sp.]